MTKTAKTAGRGIRRNVIMPPEYWDAIDAAAKKKGQCMAEFLRDAALAHLPKSVVKSLPPPKPQGRPTKEQDS